MRLPFAILAGAALGAGAFLAAPNPHPVVPGAAVLLVAVLAGVGALVAAGLGSQLFVVLCAAVALLVTLPSSPPIAWPGAVLLAAGAGLALETARARKDSTPLPPLRTWLLPVALTLLAVIVALAALLARAGRESLDLSQGVGVAVSAPFLLLAGWAILQIVPRRRAA